MRRPVMVAGIVSVVGHITGALLLSDVFLPHFTLPVAPAQRVSVNVRMVSIPEPPAANTEAEPIPEKDLVTTSGSAEHSVAVNESAPVPAEQQSKKEQIQVERAESERSEPKPKYNDVPLQDAQVPQIAAKKDVVPVESELDNSSGQGASSEYRLIDKPQFAGQQTPPAYPYRARRMGHEGTVVLDVKLGADGKIVSLDVDSTSGYPSLDKAAMQAVVRWHFLPLIDSGKGIPSRVKIPVRFRLS